MKFVVLVCLVACIFAAASADVLSQVQNGYYYGRSGDVVVHRRSHQTDSFAAFVDPNGFLASGKDLQSISELQLAASLSNILSLPHPNGDAVAPVAADMFRKPRTAVIVHVDGLTAAVAQRVLRNTHLLRVTADALPESSIGGAVTLSTGVPPAVHGIVGEAWIDTTGHTVHAFSQAHDSHSAVPTLADRVHETYGSCGAAVVFGARPEVARAFAARATQDGQRSFAFALNTEGDNFVEVAGRVPRDLTAGNILPAAFAQELGLHRRVDGRFVLRTAAGDVVFDAEDPVIAQLAGMHAAVTSAAAMSSAANGCPTAVVIAMDAFESLLSAHAEDSARVAAAGQLLSSAIQAAVRTLPGAVAAVVGAGREHKYTEDTVKRVLALVPRGAEASASAFPHIFAPSTVHAACTAVRTALRGTEYEAFCPRADSVLHRKYAVMSTGNPGVLINSTNTTYIDRVWQFNMFLWLPLFVVIVLIAIVAGFSTTENKRDSLIYRTPRPEGGPRAKND